MRAWGDFERGDPLADKVGIGLTTYQDLTRRDIGEAVFEAYSAVSSNIVPNRVAVWSDTHTVETLSEFASLWASSFTFESREDRRPGALLTDRFQGVAGAKWRRVGGISGQGSVNFSSERDPNGAHSLVIDHNYSAKVDWLQLFTALVKIIRPSYGMLHLLTERERIDSGERFTRFDSAFAGEANFTHWKSLLGEWRSPDAWQMEERRTYRYLPQLSWANVLGEEFNGQYDRDMIEDIAIPIEVNTPGVAFQTTPRLSDVKKTPDEYSASRAALRAAFQPHFFRT